MRRIVPFVALCEVANSREVGPPGHFFPIIGSQVGNFCLPRKWLKKTREAPMDIPSYVLLSHEQALKRRLDVVANNMANSSTVGFRREQPVFHEAVERGSEAVIDDAKPTSFVLDFRAIHDMAPGAFQVTGNPLDVLIEGPGYLAVAAPGGGTAYTRAGFVKILDNGDLASAGGERLLDEGGNPINVPPDQTPGLSIARDGTVQTATGPIGRLAVTVFDDETGLSPRGDGMMSGSGGRVLAPEETKLRTGGVEGSNVQPIVETTAMIDILRSYQSSVRMTESINDMRKQAISRLSRIN
jgi:flagellar basal-body rod protein FlgF